MKYWRNSPIKELTPTCPVGGKGVQVSIEGPEDIYDLWNHPMENNGIMIGRDVQLFIDLEADLTP